MRKVIILNCIFLRCFFMMAQAPNPNPYQYLNELSKHLTDSARIWNLIGLSFIYINSKPDSALLLAQESLKLSRSTNYLEGEIMSLNNLAYLFSNTGSPDRSLQILLEALQLAETSKSPAEIFLLNMNLGNFYSDNNDHKKALVYY